MTDQTGSGRFGGWARAGALGVMLAASPAMARAADIAALVLGLTASAEPINGLAVAAGRADAPRIALIAGLAGDDASSRAVRAAVEAYASLSDGDRGVELRAVPVANPGAAPLVFPPAGPAYRENAESHTLWRWLGLDPPDLVVVVGDDSSGLAGSIASSDVAGVAPIPVVAATGTTDLLSLLTPVPPSPARIEIERRRARTPMDLARLLAPIYGQSFDSPIYIDGMGLIAQLGLGNLERVEQLAAPYVDGSRDSLGGRVSTLVLAGHLLFAELARLTGDPRYLERARAAADVNFDANGQMLEATPGHGEMSDAIFMGASILAAVGELTGEQRYFDMAVRQIDFMNALVRRDDGLYRHSPLTDAAWGRGNGFAVIGYALTLSKLPASHADFDRLLGEYRDLVATLARWQNADGSFSQVIDVPGAYHETSSTAIIGFSMQRGLSRGWLEAAYADNIERAFRAVSQRTDAGGGFIDVSESTNKQPSLEAYLHREALFGRDPRTGSFALLFAVERAQALGTLPVSDR